MLALAAAAGAAAAGIAVPTVTASAASAAACDVPTYTPPTITKFTMAKSSVDVRRKAAAVPVSVAASDDDAGVASVQVVLASPQGPGGKRSYAFASLRRTAGTAKSGTFSGSATVSRWVIRGAWTVQYLIASDAYGAAQFLPESELAAKGWPHRLAVTSTPDTTAPVMTKLALKPTKVNTTKAAKKVHVVAALGDRQAGVIGAAVDLTRPGARTPTVISGLRRTSGNAVKGAWQGDLVVPRWVGKGTWQVRVTTYDAAFNVRTYQAKDLRAKKWSSAVAVVSGTDRVAPTLRGVSVTPTTVDTTRAGATIRVRATALDALSGVASASITWTGPQQQTVSASLRRTGGTAAKGTWTGTALLSKCAVSGVWKPTAVVTDVAGNVRSYSASQVAGWPSLTVHGRNPVG